MPNMLHVVVTVAQTADIDEATIRAEAQRMCADKGIPAADVALVSVQPWTEPLGDIGPYPGYDLHEFVATQAI